MPWLRPLACKCHYYSHTNIFHEHLKDVMEHILAKKVMKKVNERMHKVKVTNAVGVACIPLDREKAVKQL